MKIIVFGSTGSVGKCIVEQALQQGHEVTAFTRHPENLRGFGDQLKIFTGDIMNASDVQRVVRDQDAVLCAIGDGRKGKVRSIGTANIILAMKKEGVERLVCQTTLGLGESYGNLDFFWRHIMFGFFLKAAFKDHQMQEQHIFGSNLRYSIVRPSAFTDGESTGRYNVGFDGSTKGLSLKITRNDVAGFMLEELRSNQYVGKAVSISN